MNFLAHFELASPDPGLIAGALEGDFYKGPLRGELHPAIERGVALHRAVDSFTDNHPLVYELRCDFSEDLRRYSGILIDLAFDHYLSLHWSDLAAPELTTFSQQIYLQLSSQRELLSADCQRMADRLLHFDILNRYLDWEAVPASAARVGERFQRHNPFLNLGSELDRHRPALERVFLEFYPQLQQFSASYCRELR